MKIADEGFAARGHPFDRAIQFFCSEHQGEIFRVGRAAHAEAAADILHHQFDFVLVQPADMHELSAHAALTLQQGVHGVATAGRVECDQQRTRLHRVADQALAFGGDTANEFGFGECSRHRLLVAGFKIKRQIAGHVSMHQRCAGFHRVINGGDAGQIAVFDFDQITRVFGDGRGFGDQHRDAFADVMHVSGCQYREKRFLHRHAAASGKAHRIGQRFEARFGDVGSGVDSNHTRMLERLAGVDAHDLRLGAIGAQKHGMQLVRQIAIRGVAALAGNQATIFAACHGVFLVTCCGNFRIDFCAFAVHITCRIVAKSCGA